VATVCDGATNVLRHAVCGLTALGKCTWIPEKCPTVEPDIINPGYCPNLGTIDLAPDCTHICERDNDCSADRKCCYSSKTCTTRTCTPSVDLRCLATGYRKMFCLDEATRLARYGLDPTFLQPEDGIYRPEECYRCAERAICGAVKDATVNAPTCRWDPSFHTCLETCFKAPNSTILPCSSRSLCDCLSSDACGWCQYTQSFTNSETLETRKVSIGVCMRKDNTNKCITSRDDGGLGGSVGLIRPDFCDNASRPDGFDNPAKIITDETIKRIINLVNSGEFTAASLQEVLTRLGITDVIILVIGQPAADGEKGRITLTIVILGSKLLEDYTKNLNQAVADRFGVKTTEVNTRLQKEETLTKRWHLAGGSGDLYLQESTISPPAPGPSPSSGFSLTPIWLIALLSYLFMRI